MAFKDIFANEATYTLGASGYSLRIYPQRIWAVVAALGVVTFMILNEIPPFYEKAPCRVTNEFSASVAAQPNVTGMITAENGNCVFTPKP